MEVNVRACFRYGNLADELKPLIEDYVLSLQGRDDPPGSLLTATRDTEQLLLQKYRSQVIRKYPSSHDSSDDDLDEDVTSAPMINAFMSTSTSEAPLVTSTTEKVYGSTSTSTTERTTTGVDDNGVDDYVGGEKDDKVDEAGVAHALVHESVKERGKEMRGNNVFDQVGSLGLRGVWFGL